MNIGNTFAYCQQLGSAHVAVFSDDCSDLITAGAVYGYSCFLCFLKAVLMHQSGCTPSDSIVFRLVFLFFSVIHCQK